jgi:cell division protein FtsI (penicillin-binding protein 3)
MALPRLGHPHRRARALFIGVCIVLSLFAAQLLRLQALDASAMAAEALGSRQITHTLKAMRGDILDRSGVPLATSVERYDISVDQRVVCLYEQKPAPSGCGGTDPAAAAGVERAVLALAPVLGLDAATLREKLTGTRGFAYVKKGVEPEVWRTVSALDIPGILATRTSDRLYPAGSVGASVVGFVGADNVTPRGGLELRLNTQLTGTDGSVTYQRDPSGRQIATSEVDRVPAVDGQDVRLTLDRDLQWQAEQLLDAKVAESGALSGTLVVMKRDGEILALANAPSFDPNDTSRSAMKNLANRALSDVYEPGSTGKVMTFAAALEEGVITQSTPMTVKGHIKRSTKVFHDSHDHPPERLTAAGVLAKSSNVGTIMIGEKIAPKTMHDYLTHFGIGQPSGLNFPGESRGILAPAKDWSGSQRYTVLFGQGLSVNAVQAAGVFQTIANDGVRMPPRLIEGVQRPDGSVDEAAPASGVRVVSAATAATVRQMLEGVVSADGTAPEAKIPGYRVAGKTGTAQRFDPGCGCYRGYTASFIGMAPADHPQLIVAVTLQRPVNGHYGGSLAGPVFKQIMSYALQKLQIPPTGSKAPRISLVPGDR